MEKNEFIGMVTGITQTYLIEMLKWTILLYFAGYIVYFLNVADNTKLAFAVTYGVILLIGIIIVRQSNLIEVAEAILDQEIFKGTELYKQVRNGYLIGLVIALVIFMIINTFLAPIICKPIYRPVPYNGIPFIYWVVIYFAICFAVYLIRNRG